MVMRLPRSSRLCCGEQVSKSVSPKRMREARTRASGGVKPMMARPVCDLPEPDSPTIPKRSRPNEKLTDLTASTQSP